MYPLLLYQLNEPLNIFSKLYLIKPPLGLVLVLVYQWVCDMEPGILSIILLLEFSNW